MIIIEKFNKYLFCIIIYLFFLFTIIIVTAKIKTRTATTKNNNVCISSPLVPLLFSAPVAVPKTVPSGSPAFVAMAWVGLEEAESLADMDKEIVSPSDLTEALKVFEGEEGH